LKVEKKFHFFFLGGQHGGVGVDFVLHPLIHTLLKFNLAQDVGVSQRFSRLVNELPQTGHTLSDGLTIGVSLYWGI
jgi:hypothetical protein